MKTKICIFSIFILCSILTTLKFNASPNNMDISTIDIVDALANGEGGVEVVCSSSPGKCWIQTGQICFIGEYTKYYCKRTEETYNSCSDACNS